MLLCLQEGGLEVLEGETLYQEGWLFTLGDSFSRSASLHDEDGSTRDPLDRVRTDNRVVAGANYGLRNDLTIGALFPYVDRTVESSVGDVSADGPGDLTLFGKYRLFRFVGERSSDNLAILAGLELPTGSTDESDAGVTLPTSLQPGSGSWDPFLGGALTFERDR